MPPKNPLREDDNPREQEAGKTFIGTRIQKKTRMVLPDGRVMEFVIKEDIGRMGDDGVYEQSETAPVMFGPDGSPLDFSSGFFRFSYSGMPITCQDQWAICTSRFHKSQNRNIFAGLDGTSFGNGQGICRDCQKVASTIHIVLGILGIGILIGLFRACSFLF
jgi:hypothetical protein